MNIVKKPLSNLLKNQYLEYAEEVIYDRALPDVRDGLKPSQRKILYSMHELKVYPNTPYRKSARIIGDVLGKYHPHGDVAAYETAVKISQPFKTRYPLIEFYGNGGSIDGDNAAASRYTEMRLSNISMEMLNNLNEEIVPFQDNYAGDLREPIILPARFPNLLVNGVYGIAVGMISSMLPHNLSEVCNGILKVIEDNNIASKELLKVIKGPDLPTGGIINKSELLEIYSSGEGKVTIRGKVKIEPQGNRCNIVITEIPYNVIKSKLVEQIAFLCSDEKEEFNTVVEDVRDESNKDLRIVIELNDPSLAEQFIKLLYKKTKLESTYTISQLVLVPDEKGKLHPKILNLKQLIDNYIDYQKYLIRNITNFELKKAQKRLNIIKGLIKATNIIDEIIDCIKSSKNVKEAKMKLIEGLNKNGKPIVFDEEQAQAILDLRISRLTKLEINILKTEKDTLNTRIKELSNILSSEKSLVDEVKKYIKYIKDTYGDERRTQITDFDKLNIADVSINKAYLRYNKNKILKTNTRPRRGFVEAESSQYILVFFENGEYGIYHLNTLPNTLPKNISSIIPVTNFNEEYNILTVSERGYIKKSKLSEYNIKQNTGTAVKLQEKDKVINVLYQKNNNKNQEIVLITNKGYGIKFIDDITPVGRISLGVKGIVVQDNDYVEAAYLAESYKESKNMKLQKRNTKGIKKS